MSTSYLPEGLPVPTWESDDLQKPFWTGLQEEIIQVQRCGACQTWQWGPEWICHNCRSFDMRWVQIEGKGFIYSWSRAHHPVHVGSSRVDLQACKLEYSIVSPK